jgi:hypothetical protein
MRFLLLNDTSNNAHHGCFAVSNGLRAYLARRDDAVVEPVFNRQLRYVPATGKPFCVANSLLRDYAIMAAPLRDADFVALRDDRSVEEARGLGVAATRCADAALLARFDDWSGVPRGAATAATDWHVAAPARTKAAIVAGLWRGLPTVPASVRLGRLADHRRPARPLSSRDLRTLSRSGAGDTRRSPAQVLLTGDPTWQWPEDRSFYASVQTRRDVAQVVLTDPAAAAQSR